MGNAFLIFILIIAVKHWVKIRGIKIASIAMLHYIYCIEFDEAFSHASGQKYMIKRAQIIFGYPYVHRSIAHAIDRLHHAAPRYKVLLLKWNRRFSARPIHGHNWYIYFLYF